ncbi:hypothetical protein ACOMHN_005186 [Nucella lapillus]
MATLNSINSSLNDKMDGMNASLNGKMDGVKEDVGQLHQEFGTLSELTKRHERQENIAPVAMPAANSGTTHTPSCPNILL